MNALGARAARALVCICGRRRVRGRRARRSSNSRVRGTIAEALARKEEPRCGAAAARLTVRRLLVVRVGVSTLGYERHPRKQGGAMRARQYGSPGATVPANYRQITTTIALPEPTGRSII
jgi:hypothetical protein